MPVPKRKRSHARKNKRNANKGWEVKAITGCQNCQAPIATHAVCKSCGHYKGVKVLQTKADRAVKRGQAKQAKASRRTASAPVEQSEPQE
jgi:large subunit ribosomal protein L32